MKINKGFTLAEGGKHIYQNRRGFTLAEVLITLGVIGIVAALTIPNAVKNYQKQEYVARLKKFYSITNQAMQKMMVDNNCPGDLQCTGIFDSTKTVTQRGDSVASYFKVIKNCKMSGTEKCFANVNYKSRIDGSGADYTILDRTSSYRFVLFDGMSINLSGTDNNCGYNDGSTGYDIYRCGYIAVDVNGPTPPNIIGRDTFAFIMAKNGKLIPNCGYGTGTATTISGSFSFGSTVYWKPAGLCQAANALGWGCEARIMDEGWQMNY